jgi:hypothetical protein
MRVFLILALAWVSVASAETLACLTTFQGYRVCQGPGRLSLDRDRMNGLYDRPGQSR